MKLDIDGRTVAGTPGQTVAGVLLGAGIRTWRTSRANARPRGLFCGIGVCYDCLVTVNGIPDVRACQRQAVDGDIVETQS